MNPRKTSPARWPLFIGWSVLCLAFGVVAALTPMLNNLGYELALFSSLLCSLGSGHLGAAYPSRIRAQKAPFPGARFPVARMYSRLAVHGLTLCLAALIPPFLASALGHNCNMLEGLAFYLLLPVLSSLTATAIGLFVGLATGGKRSAYVLWFAVYLLVLLAAVREFYATPAVYSFGPFHGYFSGVLYDTLISIDSRLITFRLLGIAHVGLVLCLASLLLEPARVRLSLANTKRTGLNKVTVAVFLFALITLAHALFAQNLGHRTTREKLEAELSQKRKTPGLILHFSPDAPKKLVDALTDDAEFSLGEVESFFEVESGEPIHVFLFDNPGHKGRLMGASNTNVAKPWRSEVYVISSPPPHRILRHELGHAVAARFGNGPFAIAGSAGGLIPDPGLIEGVAVAAQGPRGPMTVDDWAAAMKRLEILPSHEKLFGLGFLDTHAGTAYTAAGSFIGWLKRKKGAAPIRELYGGASWEEATGDSPGDLYELWKEDLNDVVLGKEDLAAAESRFDKPSIIRSVCVHEVARLRSSARKMNRAGRWEEGLKLLRRAHEKSGCSTSTEQSLFEGLVLAGQDKEARSLAREILSVESSPVPMKNSVLEILADLDAGQGKPGAAAKRYKELAAKTVDEDGKRRLLVKAHLAQNFPEAGGKLLPLLFKVPAKDAPAEPLAMLFLADLAARNPDDAILSYLLARQYHRYADHQATLDELERMGADRLSQLPLPLLRAAAFMEAHSLIGLERYSSAKAALEALARDRHLRDGDREEALLLGRKIEFLEKKAVAEKRGSL